MKVLVTGGAGYIGSHTLIELRAQGHEVFVVDNFHNSSPEALARVGELVQQDIPYTKMDVRDTEGMSALMERVRPEAVIHFAGLKAVGESEEKPLFYYDVNIAGTVSLLQSMQRADCRRIVFSSSATVYGVPRYLPYDEAHPCAPNSVYGQTKQMAEKVIADWQRATPGAAAVLLRYFNPVGAHVSGRIGEDPSDIPNNLMPFVAQVAIGRRERLSVFGNDYDTPDGTGVRDYIHVTDLACAHSAALDYVAGLEGTETFNIGTGRSYSVLEVIAAFARASGREIPYEIAERRPGDIACMQADPSKANRLLGWRAEHELDEMCESTWTWQSGNPRGYGA